jgi:hypothetical protein
MRQTSTGDKSETGPTLVSAHPDISQFKVMVILSAAEEGDAYGFNDCSRRRFAFSSCAGEGVGMPVLWQTVGDRYRDRLSLLPQAGKVERAE